MSRTRLKQTLARGLAAVACAAAMAAQAAWEPAKPVEFVVPAGTDNDEVQSVALADAKVQAALAGATPKKVIVVSGRMVNIVA